MQGRNCNTPIAALHLFILPSTRYPLQLASDTIDSGTTTPRITMKKYCSALLALCLLFSSSIFATPFLFTDFKIDDYKKCQELITQCPNKGPFPESSCVEKIIDGTSLCQQAKQLSDRLNMQIPAITALALSNYIIFKVAHLENKQYQYYILSPQGRLINTLIDPRALNRPIARKYHDKSFIIVTQTEPRQKILKNGAQSFIVSIQVQNTCDSNNSCPTIGNALISFSFNARGGFASVKLLTWSDISNFKQSQ